MSIPQHTSTDSGELHEFHRNQTKNEAALNHKASMQPLELPEGTHTVASLDAFHKRQAEHHESLVQGESVHALDFVKSAHGTAQPQAADKTMHVGSPIPPSRPKPTGDHAILRDSKSSGKPTKPRQPDSDDSDRKSEGGNPMPYLQGR